MSKVRAEGICKNVSRAKSTKNKRLASNRCITSLDLRDFNSENALILCLILCISNLMHCFND